MIYNRKNWGDGLEALRRILDGILAMHSDIEPRMFRYYLGSGGTVYLRIPAPVFGGKCGVPLLPLYHHQMADKLIGYLNEPKTKMATYTRIGELEPRPLPGVEVRADVYDLPRPFMFLESSQRDGDRFTKEVDYKSSMDMYPADLWSSVEQGRKFFFEPITPQMTSIYRVFDTIIFARCELFAPNIRKKSVT